MSQFPSRWLPRAAPACLNATTSAWAVGSDSAKFRFQPRPTMCPSETITAPTGTSPSCNARWAARRASSIQSSSELVTSSVPGAQYGHEHNRHCMGGQVVMGVTFVCLDRMIFLQGYGNEQRTAQGVHGRPAERLAGYVPLPGSKGNLYRAVSFGATAGR